MYLNFISIFYCSCSLHIYKALKLQAETNNMAPCRSASSCSVTWFKIVKKNAGWCVFNGTYNKKYATGQVTFNAAVSHACWYHIFNNLLLTSVSTGIVSAVPTVTMYGSKCVNRTPWARVNYTRTASSNCALISITKWTILSLDLVFSISIRQLVRC